MDTGICPPPLPPKIKKSDTVNRREISFKNHRAKFHDDRTQNEGALGFFQALKYLLQGRLTKCPVTLSLGRTYVR
jgi:hypothetical protein